ncbi:hypothetical protein MHJ95_08670 [Corynebacterium imitans]|uniref:sulfurtransferase TusA family protein n=1 Tax=Corynebacterium imitans TaxID=156978 RepID=UPI001EF38D3B|nr:hypothetical protein [Corynebacterium imitans]MCG7279052.1 hypothetical protein [Corynebacterium imitans]MDK8305504.1 hypothetical protein [Corynebacterium imitans]MDK8636631.1 hypothetical protein [Corynebacterium imitans]MDK8771695.1 hypothetical protein [Corynebacterium imitans]
MGERPAPPASQHYWDAQDIACGDVLVRLFLLFRDQISAGEVLHLRSVNEAIDIDLRAWCGLTGNTLVYAQAPHYYLRKAG